VFDPADMLAVSRLLALPSTTVPVTQAHLRRPVSTAYYAVFHTVLLAGAARFIGSDKADTPGYSILYRSFTHGRIKAICEALDVASLSRNLQHSLRRAAASSDMRIFAGNFVALQAARHRADYEPAAEFSPSAALGFIASAEIAIAAFGRTDPGEQADVLALMLSNPRA
jgi:hypothetical protein